VCLGYKPGSGLSQVRAEKGCPNIGIKEAGVSYTYQYTRSRKKLWKSYLGLTSQIYPCLFRLMVPTVVKLSRGYYRLTSKVIPILYENISLDACIRLRKIARE